MLAERPPQSAHNRCGKTCCRSSTAGPLCAESGCLGRQRFMFWSAAMTMYRVYYVDRDGHEPLVMASAVHVGAALTATAHRIGAAGLRVADRSGMGTGRREAGGG